MRLPPLGARIAPLNFHQYVTVVPIVWLTGLGLGSALALVVGRPTATITATLLATCVYPWAMVEVAAYRRRWAAR